MSFGRLLFCVCISCNRLRETSTTRTYLQHSSWQQILRWRFRGRKFQPGADPGRQYNFVHRPCPHSSDRSRRRQASAWERRQAAWPAYLPRRFGTHWKRKTGQSSRLRPNWRMAGLPALISKIDLGQCPARSVARSRVKIRSSRRRISEFCVPERSGRLVCRDRLSEIFRRAPKTE